MFVYTPYMDTSQDENGTGPQGSGEQGEGVSHLNCHFLSHEVWMTLAEGPNPNWRPACQVRSPQSPLSAGACSLGMLMFHMHLLWLNLTCPSNPGIDWCSPQNTSIFTADYCPAQRLKSCVLNDMRCIIVTCGEKRKCGLTRLSRTPNYHRCRLWIKSTHTHLRRLIKGVKCYDLIPNPSSAVWGPGLDGFGLGRENGSCHTMISMGTRREGQRHRSDA